MKLEAYLDIKDEVKEALEAGGPIVALESTIISHGMPYPENYETAKRVEEEVRKQGAVPATIAIINGRIKIGLTDEELLLFAKAKGIMKVSRKDLPIVLANEVNGATTVAGTMICAAAAGIHIFATGGIGGVHRGAEETFDISQDLEELSRTDVAVVCAGAKSILDIGKTLEYLETKSVPVLGAYTKEFPSFYSRESGFELEFAFEDMEELAKVLRVKWTIGATGGVVIANPIPKDYAMDYLEMKAVIDHALEEANEQGVTGKEVTPFLLGKVKELTKGKSLEANIELVCNNARIAATISKHYSERKTNS